MKPLWRRWFGTRSERAAVRFLRRCGMRILSKNYRCAFGELDIVGLDQTELVFVEVRSTEGVDSGRPALSVDTRKQEQLTKLATYYLQQRRLLGYPARFDVVTVSWPETTRTPQIVHHRNAFEAIGSQQMFR